MIVFLPQRKMIVGHIEIITLYSRIITDQSCTKKHEDVEWYHFQPLGLLLLDWSSRCNISSQHTCPRCTLTHLVNGVGVPSGTPCNGACTLSHLVNGVCVPLGTPCNGVCLAMCEVICWKSYRVISRFAIPPPFSGGWRHLFDVPSKHLHNCHKLSKNYLNIHYLHN